MNILTSISTQAKLKIIMSHVQVVTKFELIHGVHMHSKFKILFDFLRNFSYRVVDLFGIPGICIYDIKARLVVNGTWPYFVVTIIIGGKLVRISIVCMEFPYKIENSTKFWRRSLQVIIVVFYISLPSDSRRIFDVIRYKSSVTNDSEVLSSSYVLID